MRLFERSVAHGVTRIRTHTDVDPVVELRSMEGILAAKRRVAASIDVEIVAFSSSRNDLAESTALARLERAVDAGADLIGASPNSSADPPRALAALLDLAERADLSVDIHLDDVPQLIATACDGRRAIEEGNVADLVLVQASSFDDALARRPSERIVFKAGRQVAGPRWDDATGGSCL